MDTAKIKYKITCLLLSLFLKQEINHIVEYTPEYRFKSFIFYNYRIYVIYKDYGI